MMITDACKTPEVALRWMDMLYDPNYAILFHNGPINGTDSDPDNVGWDPTTGTTVLRGMTEAVYAVENAQLKMRGGDAQSHAEYSLKLRKVSICI